MGSETDGMPKVLMEVDGVPLIRRSVDTLRKHGIEGITVVVGYRQDAIRRVLGGDVRYVVNDDYASTNNMVSMALGRDLGGPFLYLHGDLWYHPDIIAMAVARPEAICFMVEHKLCGDEEMKVRVENGLVLEADKAVPPAQAYGEWLGIVKFEPEGAAAFFTEVDKALLRSRTLYDCAVVRELSQQGTAVHCADIGRLPWVEIDFAEDLAYARTLAAEGAR